jgi:biopolymer transport protein ExbD
MLKDKLQSRLNPNATLPIAPLLDIIFIVLFFFLINTDSIGNMKNIDLTVPRSEASDATADTQSSIIVSITPEGIKIDGKSIKKELFNERFADTVKERDNVQVLLLGDGNIRYSDLIEVINLVKKNDKVTDITLAVEEE